MPGNNPYAPPAANVEDVIDEELRTDYGFKLGASLYWRVLVLQIILMMPVALVINFSDAGESATFLRLKPALFYSVVAAALASSLQVFRPGLLFLVWGYRLRIPTNNWRKFSWALCGLYLLLGTANTVVAIAAPTAIWVSFKTFVPFLTVIVFCVAGPRFLARSNPSFKAGA